MQQRKSETGIAAELQLVFSPQEEVRNLPDADQQEKERDEDAELSSVEASLLDAFIQAVLNSTREAIDAVESLDLHNPNSSLSH